MKTRTIKACLFGGALFASGLAATDANAQQFQPVNDFANCGDFNDISIWAYANLSGDPYSGPYGYNFSLWNSGGVIGSGELNVGGLQHTVEFSPQRFEYDIREADEPGIGGWTERAYPYVNLAVSEPSFILVRHDSYIVNSSGNVTRETSVRAACEILRAPFEGIIRLEPGEYLKGTGGYLHYPAPASFYTFSAQILGRAGCNLADAAEPFGQLSFADITAFLADFSTGQPRADLAAPFGQYTFADITAFLDAFAAGCP